MSNPTGSFHEIEIRKGNGRKVAKTILRTPVKIKSGYLSVCDLEYPSNIHEDNKTFSILSRSETIKTESFSTYLMETKPEN